MKNRIDACIEFSFKGETYRTSAKVDLDAMMSQMGSIPDLHKLLASQNNIDTFSYMYEVMEMQEVVFENAEGLAVECLSDGNFDVEKFVQLWKEDAVTTVLTSIAKRCLDIDDLDQHLEIKTALIEAYNAGKSA